MDQKRKYRPTIGLEVHVQLASATKIFSGDTNSYGDDPNQNISVITLAHPGTLPKLNRAVIGMAIKMGIACGCDISTRFNFDRKNYFYPDLPKGYQITQDKNPICKNGEVLVRTDINERYIKLHKIHLEEDAGKSIHTSGEPFSKVDLNRAGVPLIEIVTEPDMHSAEEAAAFLTEIRKLVKYLGICDGNMEEGSIRCDANISINTSEDIELGKKVEVKNMNSVRYLAKAIRHEIQRQTELLDLGEKVISETRTFNPQDGRTYGMRYKEELNDYRYFPDPDLPWVEVDQAWLHEITEGMPELPEEKLQRYLKAFDLPKDDARNLVEDIDLALFYDKICALSNNYKAAANWMMGPVKSFLNEAGKAMINFPLKPEHFVELITLVEEGKISKTIANQKVFQYLLDFPDESAFEAAKKLNVILDSESNDIQPVIEQVLEAFPEKVKAYKNGKKGLVGMFMGEVMKKTNGKVDPKTANRMIIDTLETR